VREISDYQNIIKVGQSFHTENLLDNNIRCLETFDRNDQFEEEMSGVKGLIIGGSTYALHTRRMKSMTFDTILFDEASQLTIAHSVATMMKAEKYIFIGDHKQMPPIFNASHSDELLSKSLFENLIKIGSNSTMLDITYRMNEKRNRFISETFYNGVLKTAPSIKNLCLKLKYEIPGEVFNIINPQEPNIALLIEHQGNKMESKEEAFIITYLVVLLIKAGVAAKDIGIIVPYRAQARLIKKSLQIDDPTNTLSKPLSEVVIDTVERMQGQEKDVIFISTAASDREFIDENTEFLFNPNRFNVSISRAKFKQFLICSSNLLSTESKEFQAQINSFKKLAKQSYGQSLKVNKNIFLS
jgi:DNA replication ATP-dependent helicase Dna2